jgi:hypothetical protein
MKKHLSLVTLLALAGSIGLVACSGATPAVAPAATAVATSAPAPTTPPTVAAPTAAPATVAPTEAAAAASGAAPVFSKPTEITNPFYPVSSIGQTIALGMEEEQAARIEVTLLPGAKTIAWPGGDTPVRTAQFAEYSDGKLIEIAYDYFAQADNGDVYYFGEDVSNYKDGQVVDHEGSWLAGKDGAPPALIMPANPRIGMVFNPENLPGVVYETDEVVSLSEHVMLPTGPRSDGLLIKETLMDGSVEHKIYAAGFGIAEDRSDDEQVNLVLFNAATAAPRPVPGALQTIEAQAEDIIDSVPGGGWAHINADVATVAQAWKNYGPQADPDGAPQPFRDALDAALRQLQRAASGTNPSATMQAANDLSAAVLDLFMVYQPAVLTDVGRLDVLERQVVLDIAGKDYRAAADRLAQIEAVWARLKPRVEARQGTKVAARFDTSISMQRAALQSKDGPALTAEAQNGLDILDALEQLL